MSEEMDQDGGGTQAGATCAMCDHAKHDGATCAADGCDCGTEEGA